MKTLQPLELDKIRQELINHKVEYIEVIEELTDHIANGIEQQWSESNTQISFEEALAIEINKFGVKGLSKVQTQMNKAQIYEYLCIIGLGIKEYFVTSKVFYLLAIFIGTLLLFNISSTWYFIDRIFNVGYLATIVTFNLVIMIESDSSCKLPYLGNTKRYISNAYYLLVKQLTYFSLIPMIILCFSKTSQQFIYSNSAFIWVPKSILFTLLLIIPFIILNKLRPMILKKKNELSQSKVI
ncbi:hypothetical protein HMPREF9713_00262 [Myroides odoratimimus CCUG 12700]|uniref:hypothetical protein n=1 Tax=Myroides odoratimimus TaxID=76832 RepID=UPI000353A26E|nr:hypothetical protein [Myroides odoratimimus]EPH14062.1 hypothetical protein HMPREF9713_00262 [Myroides odoratimimus CCUG 12700]